MEKYLGIIKKETKSAMGLEIKILTKFSSDIQLIEEWMKLYENDEKIILENNSSLESFFKDFEDYKPVTEDEKAYAQKVYQEFLND